MSFTKNTLRESRIQESLTAKMEYRESSKLLNAGCAILTSSDDLGVRRNLGRAGARFAPRAILSQLKKMAAQENSPPISILEVSSLEENFQQRQLKSATTINEVLESPLTKVVHLGGGHDHIYPLLMACEHKFKRIHILNIDAHLDTRKDQEPHSGTPFRQFMNETKSQFEILQIGIHPYANSKSTLDKLPKSHSILFFNALQEESNFFSTQSKTINNFIEKPCDLFIISLDADAIDSSQMEAVSAVNGRGIPIHFINSLILKIKKHQSINYFGVYEYNPIFDNLSQRGPRISEPHL